jgi:chromosome segregation ATPase
MDAGKGRLRRWDAIIEEAAAELEGVERKVQAAAEQLQDLQSRAVQQEAEAQKAVTMKEQVSAQDPALKRMHQGAAVLTGGGEQEGPFKCVLYPTNRVFV